MLTSNYTKLFMLAIAVVLFSTSCRFFQTEQTESDPLESIGKPKQTSPFETKEPDIFQTEILVTAFVDGEKAEKKYFVAKNNLNSYTAFNFGGDNETAIIETKAGKYFILDKKNKTYREKKLSNARGRRSELQNFLTTKWLNEKRETRFEKLDPENGLNKYRVNVDDSKSSDIIIFIDEKLNIPMKQEFYSVSNDRRTMTFSVELKNFKTEAPQRLFEIPEEYSEVKSQ